MIDPLFFEYHQTKDVKLRNKLVEKNAKLAYKIAHQIHHVSSQNFDELRQEALLALIKAIETYNPAIGAFSTYAVIRIKGNLYNYLRDKSSLIRIPRPFHDMKRKWIKTEKMLLKKLKRPPTKEEISLFSGVTLADYLLTENAINNCKMIGELEDLSLVSPKNNYLQDFMRQIIANYENVTIFQRKILSLFLFKNRTVKQIASSTKKTESEIQLMLLEAIASVKLNIN